MNSKDYGSARDCPIAIRQSHRQSTALEIDFDSKFVYGVIPSDTLYNLDEGFSLCVSLFLLSPQLVRNKFDSLGLYLNLLSFY